MISKILKSCFQDLGYVPTDHPVPSLFYDASIASSLDPRNTHMINPGGSITSHYHTAASYHTQEGEALFALASSSGSILLVKMPPLGIQGMTSPFSPCRPKYKPLQIVQSQKMITMDLHCLPGCFFYILSNTLLQQWTNPVLIGEDFTRLIWVLKVEG